MCMYSIISIKFFYFCIELIKDLLTVKFSVKGCIYRPAEEQTYIFFYRFFWMSAWVSIIT